jgi:hypothetical protein
MGLKKFLGCIVDAAVESHRKKMVPLAPAIEAARIICSSFNHEIDRGGLQKILFLCEMIERGHTNGQSGVIGSLGFCATDMGPVCEKLDEHLRARNTKAIRNFGVVPEHVFPPETVARIKKICAELGEGFQQSGHRLFNGFLISHTHWERGAWAKRYVPGYSIRMTVADLLEDFVNRRIDRANAAA